MEAHPLENGILVSFDPILFRLGPLSVRWFGVLVVVGLAVGALLFQAEARRKQLLLPGVVHLLAWVVPAGLVGARLAHLVDAWEYYVAHQQEVWLLQQGGLSVWGALLAGGLAVVISCRRHGLPTARVLDAAAPGVALGLAVGRLGCFVNGDHQGPPTTLPWGTMYTSNGALVPDFGTPRHPTQVYEMLYLLVVAGLLWRLRGRSLPDGALFLVGSALYALGRFALGYLRLDSEFLFGLNQGQIVGLLVLAVAVPALAHRLLRPQPERGPAEGLP